LSLISGVVLPCILASVTGGKTQAILQTRQKPMKYVTRVDKAENGKMDGTCSMHGRNDKCIQDTGRKTWMEENTLKT